MPGKPINYLLDATFKETAGQTLSEIFTPAGFHALFNRFFLTLRGSGARPAIFSFL
jgi:hypothetical protein